MELNTSELLLNQQRTDLGTLYVHVMHCIFCPKCRPFNIPFFDLAAPICRYYAQDILNTSNPNKQLYFLKVNIRKLKLIGFPDPIESPSYLYNQELLNRYLNISRIVNASVITLPKSRTFPSTNPLFRSPQVYPRRHENKVNAATYNSEKFYPLNIKEHADTCKYCKGESNLKCSFSILTTKQRTVTIYDLIKATLPPENIVQLITKLNLEREPSKRNKKAVTFNLPTMPKLPSFPDLPSIPNLSIGPNSPDQLQSPLRQRLFSFKFNKNTQESVI